MIRTTTFAAAALLAGAAFADTEKHGDYIIVHTIDGSKEEAAAALRDAVEGDDSWVFIAEFGMLGGQVLAQRVCYVPIVSDMLAAGMHTMALMPCGNLAFYEEDGQTKLARLDVGFMTALYDDENVQRAAGEASLAFDDLVESAFD